MHLTLYADFLKRFYSPRKPLKIVFDCLNSPAGPILKKIFQKEIKEKKFFLLNEQPGRKPDFLSPLEKNALSEIRPVLRQTGADFGVIFDFDADRAFFLDKNGYLINPDVIGRLLIWHLEPRQVIIDVRTGWLITKLKIKNLKLKTSKVGHSLIKKILWKEKADFGVEYSGHYYFSPAAKKSIGGKNFYFDSGILTTIEVINAVSKLPYSISDFAELLPQSFRIPEINIHVPDFFQKNQENQEMLFKKIASAYQIENKISRLDGLTMSFPDWWFNLRFGRTEPFLRLNAEAKEKNKLKEEIPNIKKEIKSYAELSEPEFLKN